MKSIFGKLSIFCFVAVFVGVITFGLFNPDDPMGMVLMALYLPILFTPLGFVSCYLSAEKKESPKCYRHIGFFLNCLSCLLLFYVSVGPMIFNYGL